jgi:hypothetical protein
MKLRFNPHSRDKILQRDLNVYHIKKAIMEPDYWRIAPLGRILVRKSIDAKVIEVVYYKYEFGSRKGDYFVITAYYL